MLRSRHLFRNWLSLGIRYWLMRRGLLRKGDLVVKCGGGEFPLSPSHYSMIVSAHYEGLFHDFKCLGDGFLLDGFFVPVGWVYAVPALGCVRGLGARFDGDLLVFGYGNALVRLPPDVIPFIYDILCENFLGGAYDDVDVRGKVVVDVGAGVGDTAVMFALRGADMVIALEPYPNLYDTARRVVELNGVSHRVKLLNAAVGSFDGFVRACGDALDYRLFRPCNHGVDVRVYTLGTLVSEFNLRGAVLKMDCEGCEYEALRNTDENTLEAFNQVIIEYHNGPEPIIKRLEEAGFKTELKPIRSAIVPIEKQGYVIGRRVN